MGNLDQVSNTPRQPQISRRHFLSMLGATAAAIAIPPILNAYQVDASPMDSNSEVYNGISIEGPAEFIEAIKASLDVLKTQVYNTPETWAANIGVANHIVYIPEESNSRARTTISVIDNASEVSPYDPIWEIVINGVVFNYYQDEYLRTLWLAAVLSHEAKHLSLEREQLIIHGVPDGEWYSNCWMGPGGEIKAYTEELAAMRKIGAPLSMQQLDLDQLNHNQDLVNRSTSPELVYCITDES